MSTKFALVALAFCAVAFSGCTGGSNDNGGNSTSTSATGGGGVGGCVTAPGGSVCGNATATGSATNTSTSPSAPMSAMVKIEGSKYVNDTVTIKQGGSVEWTHADGTTQHTVTADDNSFDSSPSCNAPQTILSDCMTQGDTYSATFATPGSYTYHCKVHSSMHGTVVVVA